MAQQVEVFENDRLHLVKGMQTQEEAIGSK